MARYRQSGGWHDTGRGYGTELEGKAREVQEEGGSGSGGGPSHSTSLPSSVVPLFVPVKCGRGSMAPHWDPGHYVVYYIL